MYISEQAASRCSRSCLEAHVSLTRRVIILLSFLTHLPASPEYTKTFPAEEVYKLSYSLPLPEAKDSTNLANTIEEANLDTNKATEDCRRRKDAISPRSQVCLPALACQPSSSQSKKSSVCASREEATIKVPASKPLPA